MSIRVLAVALTLALTIGASLASAAPPKSRKAATPPPAESTQPADAIDVDALARSKDVDAAAQDASGEPTETPPSDATPSEIPPTDPTVATPPAQEPAAPASAAPEQIPAEQVSTTPAAGTTAAETSAPESAVAPDSSAAPATVDTAPPDINAKAAADMQALSIASSCQARATSLLDDAEKARYGEATTSFDAKMRTELPAAKFKQQWESLAQFGKLTARGQSHLGKGNGYTIVIIPLIFEKANLLAQVACGSDGRIAGFHVTPADKP